MPFSLGAAHWTCDPRQRLNGYIFGEGGPYVAINV
jgi:hypothetical protein